MRKHSVWIRAGVLVAAGGLVLAACGGGDDEGGGTGGSTPGAVEIPTTTDQLFYPSDKKGGTLKALSGSDCDSWDPARTYYATCWDQQRWISRSLLNYKQAPNSAELVPDLATEVPTSPDGGKTWTYTLKDGIKFEDGSPITSKDIKYGIERVFATDIINGGPTYVIDYLQTEPAYEGPYKDPSPDKLGLTSIETPDDKTLIFHLNKPFNDWNFIMASPSATPVPQAKDTGDQYTAHPVASGPYKFDKYVPNQSLTLVRNDQWDPATDEVNKALPDSIEITMGLEAADIDNRILNGDADIFLDQTGVDTALRTQLLSDPELRKARTTVDLSGFLRYMSVTTTVKPFDNIHCRNAVAYAVNKQAQVLARGGPTAGAPAPTMLPPTVAYYADFDLFPTPNSAGDIEKAKAELEACGQPDGFSTKLTARGNRPAEVAQATAIQSDLKKIGINVTIEKFDSSQYFSAVLGIPKNMQDKGYGLAMTGWGADWPSPYGFFSSIVDGRKILDQGNSNYAELNDPVVNKGIDDGLAATEDGAAQTAWTTVDKGVVQSAAYIPLIYDKAMNIYSDRITNVFFTPGFNMVNFAALGVVR
ncbi:ABC transporter substrate-binding protein [Frankia sp. CNm7]|uniref:ABC transporter substrate-binding protein n=1 Tax=Frankia nepalensis TaxID=1836974 RepID=A0A937RH67_9ACTN|nr:ABC transporter substrate-binding protein [Frankia nepalensis]MBL7499953.1 ABC transporter substrate-binding protein [Frankia nepalensis]MBL7515061.1 ABC transporter substrate-binding protein [Frankia nepalensis]MBL7524727.1 ABC transporter substrate-binding protein [Frankia nepalensis]MBL7632133.1 ABC transporter substrate-binding protein [Frankia nepalensis]